MTELRGVLVMNKPCGFTSFDVIGKLRGILRMRRLGHTGTLDPMAEGVLPVLVGTAARACDILPDENKSYLAGFQLGKVTDTQDDTGTVLETHPFAVTRAELYDLLTDFTGEIEQIPPMYSAVQVNGKRLYELARAGKEVERPARRVMIHRTALEQFDETAGTGILHIKCGKGTYVRTIIHDMGQKLGCGACMTSLVRTRACGFTLADAHDFDTVQKAADAGEIEKLILPVDRLFTAYPELHLNEVQAKKYCNGVKLDLQRVQGIQGAFTIYRVYAPDGGFIGLAQSDPANSILRVYKNL